MIIGCSIHHARDSKKYATVYSRWSEDAATWNRFKQKYCAEAYTELMGQFLASASASNSNVFACSACGEECSQTGAETYLTTFVPGREQLDFALLTCSSCTKQLHECLRVGAEEPPNRGTGVGAQSPNNSPDPWEAVS
jgi:hypothetical protein